MSWAKFAIEALRRGETIQIRPRGHSMRGKANDGDLVTVAPCDPATLRPDDIVLVRVRGRDYLHLVKAVNGGRFQIGNLAVVTHQETTERRRRPSASALAIDVARPRSLQ